MKESLLVNTLGHAAGVLIFGIFLYLLIQDRAARRLRGSPKSMLAAALALVWNLASLVVLGIGRAHRVADTIAFSVLSLLPAVLFDLCLAGRQRLLVPGLRLERGRDRAACDGAVPAQDSAIIAGD